MSQSLLRRLALIVGLVAFALPAKAQEATVRDWDEERVTFWLNIYTKYDSTQSVIHDNQYPHVIYEVLQFSTSGVMDIDKRGQLLNQTIAKYQNILQKFDMGVSAFQEMGTEDWRVYNLFKPIADNDKFRNAASRDRIRVQDGRRDSFLSGIQRSGRYVDGIRTIFKTFELPEQLVALIFVESLFYPKAMSKVGAAGPWQIMPDTARQYITVNQDVDERFDPFIATVAAAQILRENYRKLESWPLAVTAYNHGLGGMLKAKQQHGTKNLEELIRTYRSGSFRFASKNFYAQYLAAVDAFTHYERYFGKVVVDPPLQYDRLRIPYAIKMPQLATISGVGATEIAEMNPALTTRVVQGDRPIPQGYPLRLPVGKGTPTIQALRDKEPKGKGSKNADEYQATSLPVPLDLIQK